SLTAAEKEVSSQGFSGGAPVQSVKPPGVAFTARRSTGPFSSPRKFLAWKEKTASTAVVLRLVKRYSSAATGRDESSSWPGSNGLQPVISTSSGMPASASITLAKGKRA